jgi:branched-chain amino acid transport system ATP-binding protein
MLSIEHVSAGYGDLKVLYDISMHVDTGEVVSLVGANGSGKTTLLRIISGFVPVTAGKVTFEGKELLPLKTSARVDLGIAHIPQGRGILGKLSVMENLELGAYNKATQASKGKNFERAFKMFPILKERFRQTAGSLSGGEQQMLAIARALMMEPRIIMMDEPSLGLAPIIVDEVFGIITEVAQARVSILIVEQNLVKALSVANRGYVLENGVIIKEGPALQLLNDESIREAYLGISH